MVLKHFPCWLHTVAPIGSNPMCVIIHLQFRHLYWSPHTTSRAVMTNLKGVYMLMTSAQLSEQILVQSDYLHSKGLFFKSRKGNRIVRHTFE